MTEYQGEWSQPKLTGVRVSGGDGYGGGNYSSYGGGYDSSPRRRIEEAQKFDGSHLEISDPSNIDPEVAFQIQRGLIDANDIAGDTPGVELDGPPQVIRRKVKKMVEVPVVRKVKVQCTQPAIVPDRQQQVIQVKKQVPVQEEKWVDEAYTEIEDRPATRMKEVWVKKMVPEQYTKKVEVRKSRRVKVPVQGFKEVTEDKVIEYEGTKVEDQPAWRVDEIKDTKMVEIEGWQEVELVPRVRDSNIRIEKTFERQQPRRRVERKMGTNVLDETDARLDNVDTDSDREDAEYNSVGIVQLDGSESRTRPSKSPRRSRRTYNSHRYMEKVEGEGQLVEDQQTFTPAPPSAPKSPAPRPPASATSMGSPVATTPRGTKMFGLRMKATKDGLSVNEVAPGGFAEEAGLKSGDTILSVDGSPITSVKAWRSLLSQKAVGDFLTLVCKDSSGRSRPAAVQLNNFNPSHYV